MSDHDYIDHLCTDLKELRQDLHAHPETAFEERRTSDLVAKWLRGLGIDIHRGLAKTGVIGTLKLGDGPAIGLRADMDALDLNECTRLPYSSQHTGCMHACGHDGHTTMLLGAAQYLAEKGGFNGTLHFIFQPAEENLAGGKVMVDEGLFERFPMTAVFGLHNRPGLEAGALGVRAGPVMACADFFDLRLTGVGVHAAYPHKGKDPIVAAAQIISAWQGLVSRGTDPLASAVVSVTRIQGGHTTNVIPAEVSLAGTVRAFSEDVRLELESGLCRIAESIADAHGVSAQLGYERRYRATINSEQEVTSARAAMVRTVGESRVHDDLALSMGAEDFGWLLERCPGAYGMIGNGIESKPLHNPEYDFNDAIIPVGVRYWVNLARHLLPAGTG